MNAQNTKLIDGYPYILHEKTLISPDQQRVNSSRLYSSMDQRRSIRSFSSDPFPREVLENLLRTASTAPSGAHKQPWTFCVVSSPDLKKQIRAAAEAEERESYEQRMGDEWLEDLKPLGTNWEKPFLETAPYLVIVFSRSFEYMADGSKRQNYYVKESTGLACGFLLAAIHDAGLCALTHTPSPMNFLSGILKRPNNEKPFLLIPVGFAAKECWVPDIHRKSLENISVWYD
jgi:iodotyrosine deiodinase